VTFSSSIHTTQTASLLIDGQQGAAGYHGHRQFQQNDGLTFGSLFIARRQAAWHFAGCGLKRSSFARFACCPVSAER
jgi:hypothetical protein